MYLISFSAYLKTVIENQHHKFFTGFWWFEKLFFKVTSGCDDPEIIMSGLTPFERQLTTKWRSCVGSSNSISGNPGMVTGAALSSRCDRWLSESHDKVSADLTLTSDFYWGYQWWLKFVVVRKTRHGVSLQGNDTSESFTYWFAAHFTSHLTSQVRCN